MGEIVATTGFIVGGVVPLELGPTAVIASARVSKESVAASWAVRLVLLLGSTEAAGSSEKIKLFCDFVPILMSSVLKILAEDVDRAPLKKLLRRPCVSTGNCESSEFPVPTAPKRHAAIRASSNLIALSKS